MVLVHLIFIFEIYNTIHLSNYKIEIRPARLPEDTPSISSLWFDYLTWGNNKMQATYGVHPHHPKNTVEQDLININKFLPPHGRIVLAFVDNKACGIGCLKYINNDIGELKRMFVAPSYRKLGIGRSILKALLKEAKVASYKKVRLDSPKFMTEAHALYQSTGFSSIEVYPEVEIPEEFRQYLIFMEIDV
jgi:GNAT superfamily N-acetyltransferase